MGGGGGGIPIPVGIGGTGGLIIVVIVIVLNLLSSSGGGGSLGSALDPYGGQAAVDPGTSVDLTNNGDLVEFVGYVLDDTNNLWADTFQRAGQSYTPAKMVLFTSRTQSGCGPASEATGPFYCPADQKVYLDLGFFQELSRRFGAPGDFAQAYVIAHEIGHHVQQTTGIEQQVVQAQQQDPSQANALSVKLELQADCLAGVWAYSVYKRGELDPGDVDEALVAASSVGDDRIQKQAGMTVNPETWTHGSAQQRSSWFKKGMASGDPADCDTFAGQ
jgi:predicted metalloprotease